jgi:hypothetical protein
MADQFPQCGTHPRTNCQRRGWKQLAWHSFNNYADCIAHVGRGAVALSVSREAALEMKADGFSSGDIERARRRAIVEIDGAPMTVISGRQHRGRHYFRNRPRSLADKRSRRRR